MSFLFVIVWAFCSSHWSFLTKTNKTIFVYTVQRRQMILQQTKKSFKICMAVPYAKIDHLQLSTYEFINT